jgi:phosphoglycerol transferase MdoB-like AlkP superfamily enzyme
MLPTLPRLFKAHGYASTAIHPFMKEFFSRQSAYSRLGFDAFVTQEHFKPSEFTWKYISDSDFMKKALEYAAMDEPQFVFGISVATHATYDYDEYLDSDLDVQGNLTPESHNQLKTYINVLSRADASLKLLFERLAGVERETIVIAFGDHLPLLGDNMSVYRETGFLTEGTEDYRMRTTPVIVWSNKRKSPITFNRRRINLLYPIVLEAAGIPPGRYDALLRQMGERCDAHGDYDPAFAADCRLVQFDIFHGKQYLLSQ